MAILKLQICHRKSFILKGHSWRNGLKSTLNIQLDKDYEDWEVKVRLAQTKARKNVYIGTF